MTLLIMTLLIMTLLIMTLLKMTILIMTLLIITLLIMTLLKMTMLITLNMVTLLLMTLLITDFTYEWLYLQQLIKHVCNVAFINIISKVIISIILISIVVVSFNIIIECLSRLLVVNYLFYFDSTKNLTNSNLSFHPRRGPECSGTTCGQYYKTFYGHKLHIS